VFCHGDNNITICYFLVVNLVSEPFADSDGTLVDGAYG
jgi:hypothetical protein